MDNKKLMFIGLIVIFLSVPFAFVNAYLFPTFVFIGVGVIIYAFKTQYNKEKKQFATNEKKILSFLKDNEIEYKDCLFSFGNKILLGFNEKNKQIFFIDDELNYKQYAFKDILESHIVENGNSVTHTSRSSQVGGVLIGGALLGGIGALIGGLSGSKRTYDEVSLLELCVVVNDTTSPLYRITLFDGGGLSVKKDNHLYIKEREKADHWHNLISVLIKRADESETIQDMVK